LQLFASGLPASLTVLSLLGIQGLSKSNPKTTAHQDAKDGDNDEIR
jgi:hypothetical protein